MWAGRRLPFAYAVAPRRPLRPLGSFRTGGRTDKETPRSGLCRSPHRSRRRTRRISDPVAATSARAGASEYESADQLGTAEREGLRDVSADGEAQQIDL